MSDDRRWTICTRCNLVGSLNCSCQEGPEAVEVVPANALDDAEQTVRAWICPEVGCEATVVAQWAGPTQHYSCRSRGHRMPILVRLAIVALTQTAEKTADGSSDQTP